MGTILDEMSQERRVQIVKDYIPRVFEVQAPCQWLEHCYNGKCPAFIRKNGNYYCAKKRP